MFETAVQEKIHIDIWSVLGALAAFGLMIAGGYLLIVG
jgi:hypothetical protein